MKKNNSNSTLIVLQTQKSRNKNITYFNYYGIYEELLSVYLYYWMICDKIKSKYYINLKRHYFNLL